MLFTNSYAVTPNEIAMACLNPEKDIANVGSMTNNEIVDSLARECIVERIINRISGGNFIDTYQDLSQYIYIKLLELDNNKLSIMYEQGKIRYCIYVMITRQIFSRNSNYYKEYGRFNQMKSELTEAYEGIPES